MTNFKKTLVVVLAAVLVFGLAVGSTLAWLIDKTETVTNTFVVGDGIDITLEETTGEEYEMVPGADIAKNPKASVVKGSPASWLFVKVEKSDNLDSYISYEIADGWTEVVKGSVYGRLVTEAEIENGTTYSVLKDDKVTVLDSVTTEMLNGITEGTVPNPTLSFTAYAIQQTAADTAADAWAVIVADLKI